jgi:hypothetical protein
MHLKALRRNPNVKKTALRGAVVGAKLLRKASGGALFSIQNAKKIRSAM